MENYELKKDILYNQLKGDILSGRYQASSKLPKELDFAKKLGVAKVTLRSALERLEAEYLLVRIPSKGTFVLSEDARRKRHKNNIFIIATHLEHFESPNPYILPGVKDAAHISGYETTLCDWDYIKDLSWQEISAKLAEARIKGIILLMENFHGKEPIIEKLHKCDIPVVLPHGSEKDHILTGFASIYVPHKEAWADACGHLASQGHERTAFLTLKKNNIRGYTLEEHLQLQEKMGFNTDDYLIQETAYEDRAMTGKIVREWLKQKTPPTAIQCYSDFLAIHVYEELKALGLSIPDDIAVMGCCGYPGSPFMSPPLSTVDYEYYKLGHKSIELLSKSDEWFHSAKETPVAVKPHQLVIRESTSSEKANAGGAKYESN